MVLQANKVFTYRGPAVVAENSYPQEPGDVSTVHCQSGKVVSHLMLYGCQNILKQHSSEIACLIEQHDAAFLAEVRNDV